MDGEKIPGVSRVAEDLDEVAPGMPYPNLGFGEDYVETPSTAKRGFIVPVTKEAIFFDRTHLILSRAAEVGEVLGHCNRPVFHVSKRLAEVADKPPLLRVRRRFTRGQDATIINGHQLQAVSIRSND